MTDPTGRSFLSYKRERRDEAELLIAAQRDHGIPTWQDISNLEHKHATTELRRVLDDPSTANAILWLTPEVTNSETIKQVEAPAILQRAKNRDGFFVFPVAAGGLAYDEAADVLGQQFSAEDLREWNLYKLEEDLLTSGEAAKIANHVLRSRIQAIGYALPADEPLRLELHTRVQPAFQSGTALLIDWTSRFSGIEAIPGAWDQFLLPALKDVESAIQANAPDRSIEASGLCSLPAAVALGCVFLATRGLKIAWKQRMLNGEHQIWRLGESREDSGFIAETTDRNLSASDLAVLVSVADDVEPAFSATFKKPIPFRAVTVVSKVEGFKHELSTPSQAADVAYIAINAIREARARFSHIVRIHLFMAVPAGLAMMIGQLLNTFDSVQTYQHIPSQGCYYPAALLHP